MSLRVLFHTQHLLGIGHLVRALRITEGMTAAGFEVVLVIGGVPVEGLSAPGATVLQLPPLAAGPEGFSAMVTADGRPPTEAHMAERRKCLLDTLDRLRPDAVLIEAFPFARRMLRAELLPLIERARAQRPRPLILCSVRDILQRNPRDERRRETAALIDGAFDAVLVHGEPAFATLDETFPEATDFADKVHYTGFVGPVGDTGTIAEPADVIVTAGGGAVGFELLAAALAAKPRSSYAGARWLAITGPRMALEQRRLLEAMGADTGCRVVPFLADLPAWFGQAKLAISQAGYNTVADLMAARCPAVLVPFADGGETEQTDRAARLAERGVAITVPQSELSADRLAAAIDAARRLPPLPDGIVLDGARRTAAIVRDLIRRRSA